MKIAGVILWVIGMALLATGGIIMVREKLFVGSAGQATAAVTGDEQITYTGSVNEMGVQHYYCSAFQFQTADGQSISFRESEGSGGQGGCGDLDMPPDYPTGASVPVYYDPRDPAGSVQTPKYVSQIYAGGVIVLAAGTIATLLGLGLFIAALRRGRNAERK